MFANIAVLCQRDAALVGQVGVQVVLVVVGDDAAVQVRVLLAEGLVYIHACSSEGRGGGSSSGSSSGGS